MQKKLITNDIWLSAKLHITSIRNAVYIKVFYVVCSSASPKPIKINQFSK